MYKYMVTGCQLVTLPVCDIPDAGVQALIDQVKFSALCKINNIRNCIVLFKLVPIMVYLEHYYIRFKVTQTTDDSSLTTIFEDSDMLGLLTETGFRLPLENINKDAIINSLRDYHCIIKVN